MPRRSRIHLNNVPLHIVQRGHNREPCFFGEKDYQAYLHWLGEALVKNNARCMPTMTNHVHLLITPERSRRSLNHHRLEQALRAIHQHTYRRPGTLWDRRYKSSHGVEFYI